MRIIFIFLTFIVTNFIFADDSQPQKIAVCIHGFMRTKTNMNLFRFFLKKEDWKVYSWEYKSRERLIEEHGEDLAHYLQKIAERYPESPIDFITHSMGGLILRAAMNHPDCPEFAKYGRAVLVAPPNQGTAYGRFLGAFKPIEKFAGEKAGQQLLYTEKGGFDSLGEFPETMKVLVIAGTCGFNPMIQGKNDGKVSVEETRLSTPHDFSTVFAGHSWICHTPKTAIIALEFLRDY